MKIGILTFWNSNDNYGQQLQLYALQKFLRDNGHDVYLIRYNSQNDILGDNLVGKIKKIFNPKLVIRHLVYLRKKKISQKEEIENTRDFVNFRASNVNQSEIIYNSYNELKENPPAADLYIVGSDQVWNFNNLPLYRVKNCIHAFFLDFGDRKIKKISFAASWGVKTLPQDYIKEITPLIQKFNYVTVRETSGLELCKMCGYKTPITMIDPTILVNKSDYRLLYEKENLPLLKEKFLLIYRLNNDSCFQMDKILSFAKTKNLKIVYITGNGLIDKYEKTFATIPEWIWYIDNADYVITNSFHCCVFSILFHKQFVAIPIRGRNKDMNTRLDSLFELFKMKNRVINDNSFSLLDEAYSAVQPSVDTNFLEMI